MWVLLGTLKIAFAHEGMWLPTLLKKYNIADMQKQGFKLTAQDIYNVNHASMKDAVVLFGSGCTGELISGQGLIITNHHCGYDAIQSHSSLEHDYLTNGFWAMSNQEELPNPGLAVRFLDRMEDVSARVFADTAHLSGDALAARIAENIRSIEKEASDSGSFEATVKPLFYGNQYFLYVYQVFTDVRLVGAPPSAIGKFGGDTDNWMWPRHTGDFSLFRIYANKDNKPASYSPDNVPYKPKKFFPVSLGGIQEGDFTMVLGYPGRTSEYLPSQAVAQILAQGDPDKVKIRDLKLSILAEQMKRDPLIRIKYSAKYASTSNAWKKWQGEMKGLIRLNAVQMKKDYEARFSQWVNADPSRVAQYGNTLPRFETLYSQLAPYTKAADYYQEIVQRGTDILSLAAIFDTLEKRWPSLSTAEREKMKPALLAHLNEYWKDFDQATDEKVFAALLNLYHNDVDPKFQPEGFKKLISSLSPTDLQTKIYRKSVFANQAVFEKTMGQLNDQNLKKLASDPVLKLYRDLHDFYATQVEPMFMQLQQQIEQNQKTYMGGIMEMEQGRPLFPDANKTLRVAYGKVEGYHPADGVTYTYYSTLNGIMEKDNPDVYDYNVPQKLRDLFAQKDFGQYGMGNVMPVCFTASNHTTGGNSGSPVIDANGNLIGVNFDRCWEGTMSDIMFDPDRCRNIVLDIRYALFIIDKFAGAGYLLNEMELKK